MRCISSESEAQVVGKAGHYVLKQSFQLTPSGKLPLGQKADVDISICKSFGKACYTKLIATPAPGECNRIYLLGTEVSSANMDLLVFVRGNIALFKDGFYV